MIKKVHLVFKTHLDIGFTDFADHVVKYYLDRFIPAAIDLAQEVNADSNSPPRFIWTVGSYLIDLALRTADEQRVRRLTDAIEKGYISYHALPYTLHSELCSPALFDAGLGIAARLDARFGRTTVAAKMSDVPGHTSGIIAPLVKQGVIYLHIGINAVARMPNVPPLFMWENHAGERIMVNYARTYGGLTLIPGHDEALYLLHSDDNMGPPSKAFLDKAFEDIQLQFPDALVTASTLDAFALSLKPLQDTLPVIKGEIGDTWIHGVGTDPKKTAALRELERLSSMWDQTDAWNGQMNLRQAFLEQLLLVCEHTWGMDVKKFLTDFKNWDRPDFERAKKRNLLSEGDGLGVGYDSLYLFAKNEFEKLKPAGLSWPQRSYSLFEASHKEQRGYVLKAVELLPPALKAQALNMLRSEINPADYQDEFPDETDEFERAEDSRYVEDSAVLGPYAVEFCQDEMHVILNGRSLLMFKLPQYQRVGLNAYEKLGAHYLTNIEANRDWAIPDNFKPGAEHGDIPKDDVMIGPKIRHLSFTPRGCSVQGDYPEAFHSAYGCPKHFQMDIAYENGGLMVTVKLCSKPADRRPEALFVPLYVSGDKRIAIQKMGEWIRPRDLIDGGNKRVHAVQAVRYKGEGETLKVIGLDSPLVSLFSPALLDFDGEEENGWTYFCLYNNLWGTNFKMWYDEDIVSRFFIKLTKGDRLDEV